MNERKEPTMSGAAPSTDILSQDKTTTRSPAEPPQKKSAPAAHRSLPPAAVKAKPSILTPVALLLALVSLALSGYLFYTLQQTQVVMDTTEKRIVELEGRLALADNESSQSVTAIHEKLEWADSEIRKLWGVSYDRNRKSIADNEQALASLAGNVKTLKSELTKASTTLASHVDQLKQMGLQIGTAAEQASQSLGEVVSLQKQMRSVSDQASKADTAIAALKSDLAKRVKSNEDAIEAIDAYRIKMNRDMLQIQSRINGTAP